MQCAIMCDHWSINYGLFTLVIFRLLNYLRINPYPYMDQPFFGAPEEAALYFNSISQYQPGQDFSFGRQVYPFVGQPMNLPFFQPILSVQKPESALDGPTMDKEPTLVKM